MKNIFFALSLILFFTNLGKAQKIEIGKSLPKWKEGVLDLHHINTGRGDAAFYVLPDGTTVMADAGDISEAFPRTLSPRNASIHPNNNKFPYEWLVDYIRQFAPKGKKTNIDYAFITHFHEDHFGEWNPSHPYSKKGDYQLTGLMGIGDAIKIDKILDRGYPDYRSNSVDIKSKEFQDRMMNSGGHWDSTFVKTLKEYWKYIEYHQENSGLKVEKFITGKENQIALLSKEIPNFSIRNIVGNGYAWTGEKEEIFSLGKNRSENDLSLGVKINYGNFDYFTGGDISGVDGLGQDDKNSVESHVAPVIGEVDVATLNHHGNRDSQNSYYVRTLRPRVWVQQSWSADHPGHEVLNRINSKFLYPNERDIFCTNMPIANKHVIGDAIDSIYKSQDGHILVRVFDEGKQYYVIILEDENEDRKVKKVFGPYQSK